MGMIPYDVRSTVVLSAARLCVVTALVNNVPVPMLLIPVRLCLDSTVAKAAAALADKTAAKPRRARQLVGKHKYCCTRCTINHERSSLKLHKNTYRCYTVH